MKTITLNTPFGAWEVAEIEKSTLKFTHLKNGISITLESAPNFRSCSASHIIEHANRHGYKLPSVVELEFITFLYNNGLREWINNNNIEFSFGKTYITKEVLSTNLENPYGEDFTFKKYVCYNTYNDEVRVLDGEMNVRYILVK